MILHMQDQSHGKNTLGQTAIKDKVLITCPRNHTQIRFPCLTAKMLVKLMTPVRAS